jgi:hypothetical protein
MRDEKINNSLQSCDPGSTSSQVKPPGAPPRWLILGEIALIFAVFYLQGAWPAPDVNEPYYLGKAIHYWNPRWAAGDFFLQTNDTHQVFYFTFGWLSLLLTPAALAWAGRLTAWWLLAWSWRRLSFALLPRRGWSVVTAALFAVLQERCSMAGEWVIGGIEAKVFAYVFIFLGLECFVRNLWNFTWLLFGAAAALHVLVGGWAVVATGLSWLLIGRERPRLGALWPGLLAGFILALPGLLPALLLNISSATATIRQANQIYVFERLPHHLNIFQMNPEFILRFLLLTAFFFVLCWRILLKKKYPPPSEKRSLLSTICNLQPKSPLPAEAIDSALYRLSVFVSGSLIIVLAGAAINLLVFFDCDLAAAGLRYYWFRLADVTVPLAVAILGCWWFRQTWRYRPVISCFIAAFVGLGIIGHFADLLLLRMPPAAARADRLPNPQAWREACLWAAHEGHTPPTARFITPRLAQTFKWYAGRAEVANWKEVPQDAADIVEWWTRMQDLFAADGSDPQYRWRQSLNELGARRLKELGEKYQAGYVITATISPPLDLEIVYQNESYTIYRLPSAEP